MSMTEAEALKKWRASRNAGSKINYIKIGNRRFIDIDKDERDPNFGKIIVNTFDEAGELTESILEPGEQFYVMGIKVACLPPYVDGEFKYRVPEADKFHHIHVFDKESGDELFKGPYQEAKERFGLRYAEAAYILYQERIYRWLMKGNTMSSMWAVQNDMTDAGSPHYIKVKTVIRDKAADNPNIEWHDVAFELGEAAPVAKALEWEASFDEHTLKLAEPKKAIDTDFDSKERMEEIDEIFEVSDKKDNNNK